MLTVIAGEDTAKAREIWGETIASYRDKGFLIESKQLKDLTEIGGDNGEAVNLFGQSPVYLFERLSKLAKGRTKTKEKELIAALGTTESVIVLDWEGGSSGYELGAFKKMASRFLEAKPAGTIFDLLDACIPNNLRQFLKILDTTLLTQDEHFVYTLLIKHMRKVLLARLGGVDPKTPPWQRGKLVAQSKRFDEEKLFGLYEGLVKIDIAQKTGATPYSLRQSVELLVCYYLK